MLPQSLRGFPGTPNFLILEFAAAIQWGILIRVTYNVAVRTKYEIQAQEQD